MWRRVPRGLVLFLYEMRVVFYDGAPKSSPSVARSYVGAEYFAATKGPVPLPSHSICGSPPGPHRKNRSRPRERSQPAIPTRTFGAPRLLAHRHLLHLRRGRMKCGSTSRKVEPDDEGSSAPPAHCRAVRASDGLCRCHPGPAARAFPSCPPPMPPCTAHVPCQGLPRLAPRSPASALLSPGQPHFHLSRGPLRVATQPVQVGPTEHLC